MFWQINWNNITEEQYKGHILIAKVFINLLTSVNGGEMSDITDMSIPNAP